MLRVGSLFSGIGGFDLGLERAGMQIEWQCESDPYCRKVLAKHWPDVPRYHDIRKLKTAHVEWVEVLCGGFPCQDLSVAGKGEGLSGPNSCLWSAFHRIISELRPNYVIVENVTGLLARGFGCVLGDLAACGYDAEWDCLPAAAFGAPHLRDRVWIVAYPAGATKGRQGEGVDSAGRGEDPAWRGYGLAVANAQRERLEGFRIAGESQVTEPRYASWWETEPDICRVADGIPSQVDRLHALGNALVPQIAEWIGRRIVAYESLTND